MGYLFYRSFAAKATIGLWHTGFAEVLLGQDVGGNLAPMGGDFNILHFEDNLAVGVTDYRRSVVVLKLVVHRRGIVGVVAFKLKAFGG